MIRLGETNARYSEKNEEFRTACETAGLPTTSRQASKYRRKIGLAYKLMKGSVSKDEVEAHQKGFKSN